MLHYFSYVYQNDKFVTNGLLKIDCFGVNVLKSSKIWREIAISLWAFTLTGSISAPLDPAVLPERLCTPGRKVR